MELVTPVVQESTQFIEVYATTAATDEDMEAPVNSTATIVDLEDGSTTPYNSQTNNLTAVLSSNSSTTPIIELESTSDINEANITSQTNSETNSTDDVFGNMELEFSIPTMVLNNETILGLNTTESPELQITEGIGNEFTTEIIIPTAYTTKLDAPTNEANEVKPVMNVTETTNITVPNMEELTGSMANATIPLLSTTNIDNENAIGFDSSVGTFINKTLGETVDALVTLANKEDEKPANSTVEEVGTLSENSNPLKELNDTITYSEDNDMEPDDISSTLIDGLQNGMNPENTIEGNFMGPLGQTSGNVSSIFGTDVGRDPEKISLSLDNLTTVENKISEASTNQMEMLATLNATLHSTGDNFGIQMPTDILELVTTPNASFNKNMDSELSKEIIVPLANVSNNVFGSMSKPFEVAMDARPTKESIGDIINSLEQTETVNNQTAWEIGKEVFANTTALGERGASELSPEPKHKNFTSSLDIPTSVTDLLELIKTRSEVLRNPVLLERSNATKKNQISGGKFRRSTSTQSFLVNQRNLKHELATPASHVSSSIPLLASNYRSRRVAAQRQRGNITYKCYTVRVKEQNKTKINKGCVAVPVDRAALGVLVNKYGLGTLEDYQVCSEDKCNRSSSGALRLTEKILTLLVFARWFLH
ncbi:uncharacterized protein [Eurosta solidaginis]